jgi:hypothetical protein
MAPFAEQGLFRVPLRQSGISSYSVTAGGAFGGTLTVTCDDLDAVTGSPEPAMPILFAFGLCAIPRRRHARGCIRPAPCLRQPGLPPGTIRAAAHLGHDTIDSRNLSLLLTCPTADG